MDWGPAQLVFELARCQVIVLRIAEMITREVGEIKCSISGNPPVQIMTRLCGDILPILVLMRGTET